MNEIGVILVDNHPDLARITKRFLQQDEGVTVVEMMAEQNLVRTVEQTHSQIVLLDMEDSTRAALDMIATLRTCLPELGIIAVTLFDTLDYREATLAAGANDFIPKDALGKDLLAAIHRVVEKHPIAASTPPPQPDQAPLIDSETRFLSQRFALARADRRE